LTSAASGSSASRPHGIGQRRDLLTAEKRRWLTELDLPAAAREQVTVALSVIDALDAQSEPLTRELRAYGRRQPGCRALMRHYGIGALTAVTILAELGDARRFSSSRHAVRYAGLDITVHQSDQRRSPGQLSRQGPPALRWALYEAAQLARRDGSPDHAYYEQAAARLGGNCACLAMARKLLKRGYHTLRELGDEALQRLFALASCRLLHGQREQAWVDSCFALSELVPSRSEPGAG
jgi:transposase